MVHLPYLQPFADMNKRTSRLAANLPLFRANLCPLTFLDVPEHAYSRTIVTQPQRDPLASIELAAAQQVPEGERSKVQALIVQELRRLHEGVLARYGLRPSEYTAWKAAQGH